MYDRNSYLLIQELHRKNQESSIRLERQKEIVEYNRIMREEISNYWLSSEKETLVKPAERSLD